MPRVLIVATTSYAGMGPYVSEIVNNFTVGDDVYYFFHDCEDDFFKKNVKSELHVKSFFVKDPNNKINKLYELIFGRFTYQKLILKTCKNWEIQVAHFINGCPNKHLQNSLAKMGVKCIATVHDLHPHEAKKAWYKMLRFKINEMRKKEAISKSAFIITNSVDQQEELKTLYPNKYIAYHSFPTLVTKNIENGSICPNEIKNLKKPYILFFGRLEEYKGIAFLYEAFCKSEFLRDNFFLVIAGSGQISFEPNEHEKNVIWVHRYIKDEEVASLYRNAQCVAYPYISATQSGVLSLAFYFQVPTIASDVPFFKSSINNTGTGILFEKGNVQDLTEKLSQLLEANNAEMKKKQRKFYETVFAGNSMRESLIKIYLETTRDSYEV